MANSTHIPLPERFPFDNSAYWDTYKSMFDRYCTVANVTTDKVKVDCLLYAMGPRAEEIYNSFTWESENDKMVYSSVIRKFSEYFNGRTNTIYQRALFNRRMQKEGESIDDFITDLHKLAKYCNYGDTREEMIRDRLVVGVRDMRLSEKMQLQDNLNYRKALEMARSYETVLRQNRELHQKTDANATSINRVQSKGKKQSSEKSKTGGKSWKCYFCGGNKLHKRDSCPARESECNKCSQIGHWSKVCKKGSKTGSSLPNVKVNAVTDDSDYYFVGSVKENDERAQWEEIIRVGNIPVKFRLDSGADVSVIRLPVWEKYLRQQGYELVLADKKLVGPSGKLLEIDGMFKVRLRFRQTEISRYIYVARDIDQCLLGRRECVSLKLIARCRQVAAANDPFMEFPSLFTGLGLLATPYNIKLKPDAKPHCLNQPRRVPLPLMTKLKQKLNEMLKIGVIKPVDVPTEWCSGIVIVKKRDTDDIRVCVDLTFLNRAVARENHPMPVVEHTFGQMPGAKFFSKLDCVSGFWQVPLSEESQLLTTFITPFGRFCFLRVPFGISSAPEHYQKRISRILEGLEGVANHLDDVIVWGKTRAEHDVRLRQVLKRLEENNVTLNKAKCVFGVQETKFLGHVISASGISIDPSKIDAITKLESPKCVSEVRSFIGMVQYLGKFVPKLCDLLAPMYELLKSDSEFQWQRRHRQAFSEIIQKLTSAPCLAIFDSSRPIVLTADSSSYGLGAVLRIQDTSGAWRPVAFASRTLSDSEKRYAQIEKEALALTWACERFHEFIYGIHFSLETDHKPLVPLLQEKNLDELSPRLQRLRMRLMHYNFDVFHSPGKEIVAADFLSRAPVKINLVQASDLEKEVEAHVSMVVQHCGVSDLILAKLLQGQQNDAVCRKLKSLIVSGWKSKEKLEASIKPYFQYQDNLSINEGLIMFGLRVLVPVNLREEALKALHLGHQGIVKCRDRAKSSLWWPGISSNIKQKIEQCQICAEHRPNRPEPLLPSKFPDRPWEVVAMDFFKLKNCWYLLIADYYSRYPELYKVQTMTARTVVQCLTDCFARHGIPSVLRSDNGPQFDPLKTREFIEFKEKFGFKHVTSSPHYPKSNGFIEIMVKTVKLGLKKTGDMCLFLMEYRSTPLECGFTPSELLMGRKIRSLLPIHPDNLRPTLIDRGLLLQRESARIQRQKDDHDRKHYTTESIHLKVGDEVWIKDIRMWGVIKEVCSEPRSFIVNCAKGDFRRSRSFLTKLSPCESREQDDDSEVEEDKEEKPLVIKEDPEEAAETIPESTRTTSDANLHQEATPRRGTRDRKPPEFFHSDPRFSSHTGKNTTK